ncbi:MAG: histidinol-phosphate transaminase [Rhodospirillales bacterium]|nr:histidinol-phosphate transaminase [Rhodospirillales bacterium]MCW8951878.1 histidinol-phosphate transaminase [Rhodospirillales bacterium]MCW8971154.1 histidinol-phosphate transaminase [Rhodospirillales bacterium]MCW9002659.1 histidinol-phosphate transaminase [Rhodospirillales bacterium]
MSKLTPKPGIMDITPYVGGESAITGVDRVIKLASNEGAFGPSPKATEALQEMAGKAHRYPDGGCSKLRKALSEKYSIKMDQIVCGAGSDELITMICRAYAGPGDEVLFSQHGFLMYAISAKSVGATPVQAPETNLTASVDALLSKVNEKTRLLFIANPNNPTGTFLNSQEMKRLHAGLPKETILVIDAAYAEYVETSAYNAGAELVENNDNVVMLRTFSKIHALGGLRVGWGYFPPAIADVMNRVRNPFNVSSAAQEAAVAALADDAFAEKSRKHNDEWLRWTTKEIRALGLDVPDSLGNFVLVRFPMTAGKTAEEADAFLKKKGIITRRMVPYGLPDALRITIGLEDEMKSVVDALREFVG